MATGRKYKLRTDSTCIQVQTQVSGAVRQQKAAKSSSGTITKNQLYWHIRILTYFSKTQEECMHESIYFNIDRFPKVIASLCDEGRKD